MFSTEQTNTLVIGTDLLMRYDSDTLAPTSV